MTAQRTLGVDHGDARVGLALSDELNFLAHPLETIDVKKTSPIRRIREIVDSQNVGTIVVGLPRNMDGSHGPAAEKVTAFVEKLRSSIRCKVVTSDERLSTVAAQRNLRESGRKAHQQRAVIDQAAAQIILQTHLDSPAGLPPLPDL
ncbi:MAG: Holliday junction resolvase RuvX [Chthoniobacterales bacterium]